VEFRVESHPDPLDIEFIEAQIRREAAADMGLGDELDLAIFVREGGAIVAGISGWTWVTVANCRTLGGLKSPRLRPRMSLIAAPKRGRGSRVLTDCPLHLRLSGQLSMNGMATNWSVVSQISHPGGRPLVPQAPLTRGVPAGPVDSRKHGRGDCLEDDVDTQRDASILGDSG